MGQTSMSYTDTLEAEVASWLIPDEALRLEKFRRERIRHYKLVRDLLLDKLGTEDMDVLEVGGGPMPISDLLRFRSRTVIDPLSDEYRKVIPCPDHLAVKVEDFKNKWPTGYGLVLATNSLDHVEDPAKALAIMFDSATPTGY